MASTNPSPVAAALSNSSIELSVPVALIDEHFPNSKQSARLEVLRTWPLAESLKRLELIDVNRSEVNLPIICELTGLWSSIDIAKYDVLSITAAGVVKSSVDNAADELEHPFKLLYDDSNSKAELVLHGYKDRILNRPGKTYTLATLKGQK
jgi:hypothetical protein